MLRLEKVGVPNGTGQAEDKSLRYGQMHGTDTSFSNVRRGGGGAFFPLSDLRPTATLTSSIQIQTRPETPTLALSLRRPVEKL